MAGSEAAPGPVSAQIVERQPVPAEVELDVEGQARVAAGQHEAVAAGPGRIGRIVAHQPLEEQQRCRSEAHGRAWVAVPGTLHESMARARTISTVRRSRSVHSKSLDVPARCFVDVSATALMSTGVARSALNPASSPHVCLVIKQSQRAYPGGGCLRDARRRTPQPSSTRSSGVPASEAAHDLWRRDEGRLVPLRWPGLPVLVP